MLIALLTESHAGIRLCYNVILTLVPSHYVTFHVGKAFHLYGLQTIGSRLRLNQIWQCYDAS